MKTMKIIELTAAKDFYDVCFSGLKLDGQVIENKTFENCQFKKSSFIEAQFVGCKWIDCEFIACNLSAIKFSKTLCNAVVFDECKLLGVNWTQVRWPFIALSNLLQFYRSNISQSSFYGLDLQEIVIESCRAHEVDFRTGDFSRANFISTDFERSLFTHTNLTGADFTEAFNYAISPVENTIAKAKFSLPDAMNLLHYFDIEVV